MLSDLKETQIKILTYGVYGLMGFLTLVTIWVVAQVMDVKTCLPKEYVRLERYQSDETKTQRLLDKIDNKIDILMVQKNESKK